MVGWEGLVVDVGGGWVVCECALGRCGILPPELETTGDVMPNSSGDLTFPALASDLVVANMCD